MGRCKVTVRSARAPPLETPDFLRGRIAVLSAQLSQEKETVAEQAIQIEGLEGEIENLEFQLAECKKSLNPPVRPRRAKHGGFRQSKLSFAKSHSQLTRQSKTPPAWTIPFSRRFNTSGFSSEFEACNLRFQKITLN
jgi:hypothetical protein